MNITFVTGNENKRREVAAILDMPGLMSTKIDLPEKQSMDLKEIVTEKLQAAFKWVGAPVLVEDVSYEVEAVNGFPGPFVKFWEKAGLHDGVMANIEKTGNSKAKVLCAVAYKDAEHEIIVLETLYGRHVAKTDGKGWGFDFYFIPDGQTETFAQMGPERKIQISHRTKAFLAMKEKLQEAGITL
ncbi:MAG: non-canonical purine NTP pyrophosphatase [Patescibacteria group bacterium]|jgi:non-canonical purine NTP pyrophosphatase (RdgB/HAM1 family)